MARVAPPRVVARCQCPAHWQLLNFTEAGSLAVAVVKLTFERERVTLSQRHSGGGIKAFDGVRSPLSRRAAMHIAKCKWREGLQAQVPGGPGASQRSSLAGRKARRTTSHKHMNHAPLCPKSTSNYMFYPHLPPKSKPPRAESAAALVADAAAALGLVRLVAAVPAGIEKKGGRRGKKVS